MHKYSIVPSLALLAACGALIGGSHPMAPAKGPLKGNGGFEFRDGGIYNAEELKYRLEENYPDQHTSGFTLKSTSETPLLSLTCMDMGSTHRCHGEFPSLDRYYDVDYPEVPVTEVLAGLLNDGVVVDGKLDLTGLERYAQSRNFSLIVSSESHKRMDAAAKQNKCRECTEDFRACQVEAAHRRQNPRPGLTYTLAGSCESDYQFCSQEAGSFVTEAEGATGEACGPVPR